MPPRRKPARAPEPVSAPKAKPVATPDPSVVLGVTDSGPPGTVRGSFSSVEYAPREVGTTSESVDWIITNQDDTPVGGLIVLNSNPDDFGLINTCTPVLAAGASCTISIRFSPRSRGARTGTVQLATDTGVLELAMKGTGSYRLNVQLAGTGSGSVISSAPGIACGETCTGLFSGPVLLQARTQNGQDSLFTGWSSSSPDVLCPGPRRECVVPLEGSQTVIANFAAQTNNLIFVSSKHYPANLGGLAPYDAECNALASAAGINDAMGSAFMAVMSDAADGDPVGNLVQRLGSARGWVRMDGFPVAESVSSLFIPAKLYAPMFDELGARTDYPAWTGLDIDRDGGDHCGRWTSARVDSYAPIGDSGSLLWWAQELSNSACSEQWSILCIGKSKQQPLGNVITYAGKRLWQTTTTYTPGVPLPTRSANRSVPRAYKGPWL